MGASVHEKGIYCHTVPGRMRLKLPKLKGAPQRAERVVAAVRQLPGVTDAAANPTTGSLLVLFDPQQLDPESLIVFLQERGEIDRDWDPRGVSSRTSASSRQNALASLAWSAGSALGKEILRGALGRALRDSPWSVLLAVV